MNNPLAASIATTPLPPSILKLWRAGTAVAGFVLIAAAVAVGVAVRSSVVLGAAVLLAGGVTALIWWSIELRYRTWRWGIDAHGIEQRSGVIVRVTQVVPRSRVQTLTTRAGPIDRWLKLSSIVVHTAGTHTPNLTVPHLEAASADWLRRELAG